MSHKSDDEFVTPPLESGIYQHYKSPDLRYQVIGVGFDTETDEPVVIYKPLYKSSVQYWVRPYEMFIGNVTVNGVDRPRFKKIND